MRQERWYETLNRNVFMRLWGITTICAQCVAEERIPQPKGDNISYGTCRSCFYKGLEST